MMTQLAIFDYPCVTLRLVSSVSSLLTSQNACAPPADDCASACAGMHASRRSPSNVSRINRPNEAVAHHSGCPQAQVRRPTRPMEQARRRQRATQLAKASLRVVSTEPRRQMPPQLREHSQKRRCRHLGCRRRVDSKSPAKAREQARGEAAAAQRLLLLYCRPRRSPRPRQCPPHPRSQSICP